MENIRIGCPRWLVCVLFVFTVSHLAGCLPGREGWSCTDDSDCRSGFTCKAFGEYTGPAPGGTGEATGRYCVRPDNSLLKSSSTYGWPTLLGMWALCIVLLGGLTITAREKVKEWLARRRPPSK